MATRQIRICDRCNKEFHEDATVFGAISVSTVVTIFDNIEFEWMKYYKEFCPDCKEKLLDFIDCKE